MSHFGQRADESSAAVSRSFPLGLGLSLKVIAGGTDASRRADDPNDRLFRRRQISFVQTSLGYQDVRYMSFGCQREWILSNLE